MQARKTLKNVQWDNIRIPLTRDGVIVICDSNSKVIVITFNLRAIGGRASEASETLSGATNENRRYIYIYIRYVQDTLVARTRCYVLWEELSVSNF